VPRTRVDVGASPRSNVGAFPPPGRFRDHRPWGSPFPTRMRFFSVLLLSAVVLVGAVRPALAAELVYDAPPECPPRETAIARLGARGSRAPSARVTIQRREPTGFSADAVLGDGDESVSRHLEGETCAGLLDALKVVLSVDKGVAPVSRQKLRRRKRRLPRSRRRRRVTMNRRRGNPSRRTSARRSRLGLATMATFVHWRRKSASVGPVSWSSPRRRSGRRGIGRRRALARAGLVERDELEICLSELLDLDLFRSRARTDSKRATTPYAPRPR